MAWPDALTLCKLLAEGVVKASKPEDGQPAKPLAQVVHDAAVESEAVIEHVLDCCLVAEDGLDIRKLPASVAVRVVSAALDLTLNDEVLAAGNGLAVRLRRAMDGTANSARSSIS
jgi:hypothetical protein